MEENQTISQPQTTLESTSHDDFDWSVDKRNVASYSKEKREQLEQVYDSTFKAVADSELLQGIIVGVTKTDVIINIGFKSDGLVSMNEFRDLQDIKIGDEVEVMVVGKRRPPRAPEPEPQNGSRYTCMAEDSGLLQNRRSGNRYHNI